MSFALFLGPVCSLITLAEEIYENTFRSSRCFERLSSYHPPTLNYISRERCPRNSSVS